LVLVSKLIERKFITVNFSEAEVIHYVDLAASFIQNQRDVYYESASYLSVTEIKQFEPFFSQSLLKGTRFFQKRDGIIKIPDFVIDLRNRGLDFPWDGMWATTFIDVVVAYRELDMQTKFHELVHSVQYEKLGLKQFAAKYMRSLLTTGSYGLIPLEINAYALDKTYSSNTDKPFSVEAVVQRLINEGGF
jgi:hypothetical protein